MNTANTTYSKRISVADRLSTKLFATSVHIENGVILFRLIAAIPLALVMFASRERLPYWEIAIAAIVVMLITNIWLRSSNKSNRIPAQRTALLGSAIDTALVLVVSFLAIRASADLNSTSEMWLIFPLVILTFVYRSKPLVGIVYAVLLTAWYSVNIIAFFDPTDRAMTELPIRATFFLLMGVLAALLGNNLRQQSAE